MESLAQRWQSTVLLADGAMGTLLFGRDAGTSCVELCNVSSPDHVARAHREYLDAGAELIETNTFAANRLKLAPHEAAGEVGAINRAGVDIAKRAAAGRAYVAGSIGPIGALLRPIGTIDRREAFDVFAEHVAGIAEGEPDLLLLETFGSLEEASIALAAAKQHGRGLPVLVSLSVLEDGKTANGDELLASFERLVAAGADAVGVNCAVGPQAVFDALAPIMADLKCPVSVMPNAGYPRRIDDRTVYQSTPAYFARFAAEFVTMGATIVGGCCGTTPEHIAAMSPQVKGKPVRPRRRRAASPVIGRESPAARPARSVGSQRTPTPFEERLGRAFVTTVELTPPRNADPAPLVAAARLLQAAGADAIHISDGGNARPSMSGASAASIVMRETGLAAILHVSCRDRNLVGLQSELLGAAALGIPAIVALTGDPLNVGDFPKATSVFDVTAVGLTKILRALNEGKDPAGRPLGAATRFRIGAAVNPLARDLAAELKRLDEKVEAGADFAVTQPVFASSSAAAFLDAARSKGVPVLVGVLPLHSAAQAEFMHNEVPGMEIPEDVRDRLKRAGDEAAEGAAIARALLGELASMPGVAGAYVVAQERYEAVAEIVSDFRRAPAPS